MDRKCTYRLSGNDVNQVSLFEGSPTPPKIVDVKDAQAELQELVSLVETGVEITLTRNGRPVARLVPVVPTSQKRTPGLHRGAVWTSPDFDDLLPDEFWLGSMGRTDTRR
jgi:prevent-host-death family protein